MSRLNPERREFLDQAIRVLGEEAAIKVAKHPNFPDLSLVVGGLSLLRFRESPTPSGEVVEFALLAGAILPTQRAVREAKKGGISQSVLEMASRTVVPVQLMHYGYQGVVEKTWGAPGTRAFPVLSLVAQEHLVPMPELPQGYMLANPENSHSHMVDNHYAVGGPYDGTRDVV